MVYANIFSALAGSSQGCKNDVDITRHCLKLSGRVLNVSVLLNKKKFGRYGHKEGALKGFRLLQEDDLGTLNEFSGHGNSKVFLSQHNVFVIRLFECTWQYTIQLKV